MTAHTRFPRPDLAAEMAAAVSGRQKWNNDADGLFLAAPRRTGKSTFLKGDLKPALEALGAEVLYLDFWSNLRVDPAELLYAEVGRALSGNAGFTARMAERARLSKVKVGAGGSSLEFDASRIGQAPGSSLVAAFRELSEAAGKPVALLLDEAQHLMVSPRGEEVLKELKAVRDTLNDPDRIRLMLVMSGSDRDKLGRLTNSKAAAFYGSRIKELPTLGPDYLRWLAGLLAMSNPALGRIDVEALDTAFQQVGRLPKVLDDFIGYALNPVTRGDRTFEQALLDRADEHVRGEHARYASLFLGRTPTQRAVLTVLMDSGDAFSPYQTDTRKAVGSLLCKTISAASIQSALEGLRKLEPPMVWKSNRGEYALDDLGMKDWFLQLRARGEWPPA